MYKINNYFKTLVLLVLITIPNFAKNSFVFKRDFDPTKSQEFDSENTVNFISSKKLYKHIAHIESKGKYNVVSSFDMLGKYQVSRSTLHEFGYSHAQLDSIYSSVYSVNEDGRTRYYFNTDFFSPKEQERFIRWYTKKMERILLKEQIQKYVGTTIGGVYITKAGILHASMLGQTHVKRFLETNGKVNYTPRRGYSVKQRLQQLENVEIVK